MISLAHGKLVFKLVTGEARQLRLHCTVIGQLKGQHKKIKCKQGHSLAQLGLAWPSVASFRTGPIVGSLGWFVPIFYYS